jgi:sec-independent protein translocase protein TatA
MFGNLGFGELMIILVIVLVLFGAKRIPEISASFGKGIREFKKNVNDVERSITEPEPTRYDSRLAAGEPTRTQPAPQEEVRPEPKRLI